MDGSALAKGLQSASAAAYGAMSKPVEGTMLTVGREAGEAAGASGSSDVIETLRVAADESQRSVERTPELVARFWRAQELSIPADRVSRSSCVGRCRR